MEYINWKALGESYVEKYGDRIKDIVNFVAKDRIEDNVSGITEDEAIQRVASYTLETDDIIQFIIDKLRNMGMNENIIKEAEDRYYENGSSDEFIGQTIKVYQEFIIQKFMKTDVKIIDREPKVYNVQQRTASRVSGCPLEIERGAVKFLENNTEEVIFLTCPHGFEEWNDTDFWRVSYHIEKDLKLVEDSVKRAYFTTEEEAVEYIKLKYGVDISLTAFSFDEITKESLQYHLCDPEITIDDLDKYSNQQKLKAFMERYEIDHTIIDFIEYLYEIEIK